MEAGAAGGRIETAPKIQMMKDLLTSMGVEEATRRHVPPCLLARPSVSAAPLHCGANKSVFASSDMRVQLQVLEAALF